MSRSSSLGMLIAVLLVMMAAVSVGAQTSTSRLSGTVVDGSGAVVPGAKVTVKNEATGVAYTQVTTDAGLYSFANLPVGSYAVTVEKAGFKTTNKNGNPIEVGSPGIVDVALEVGATSEVVNIQGGYEKIQTANATMGNVVDQKAIETLPLNGRNPLTLITLEPGVVQRSAGGAGSGTVALAGAVGLNVAQQVEIFVHGLSFRAWGLADCGDKMKKPVIIRQASCASCSA